VRAATNAEYVDASFGSSEEGGFSDDAGVSTLAKATGGTLSGILASELARSLISVSTVSPIDSGRIAFIVPTIAALS
jgi:hypothetical protein